VSDRRLASTLSTLAEMHKISDAIDLRHPRIEHILRRELGYPLVPCIQRTWEFALVYAALEAAGMLDGTRVGISCGAGFERLLYALSRRVARLHVTDLYVTDSVWREVQTADAAAELARRAPIPWRREAVEIAHMDMRDLSLPDATLDFAYSISSIEHIGEDADFLAHLREIRRVLKPDGIYVLTTTLTLLPETIRQPGCYLFAEPHLRGLIHEAGFSTPGPLDLRIQDDAGNVPGFRKGSLDLPEVIYDLFVPQINVLYRSEPYAACCLVLGPGGGGPADAPDVEVAKRSRATILDLRDIYVKQLWDTGARVVPRYYEDFLDGHPEYFVFTEVFWFGTGLVEWELLLTCREADWSGSVLVFLQSATAEHPERIAHEHASTVSLDLVPGQCEPVVLRCDVAAERGYALVARVEEGESGPEAASVVVRRVGD
jgi:SAM-dependent methyltransferase